MVRPCSKNDRRKLPKIALTWMPKQKRARGRPQKSWMESIRKAMNERNLNEGQWDNVEKRFETDIYIYIYILLFRNTK